MDKDSKMRLYLIKLRETSGLSQEEFAGFLGCSRSLIALVESGRKNMSLNLKLRICTSFNISLHEVNARIEYMEGEENE